MSLDTLLEAAKYLDHIQKTDSSDGERHDYNASDGYEDTEDGLISSDTYHLKVDPNVPISVQFHTYTSCGTGLQPMAAMASQSERLSKVWNTSRSSTKRNAQNVGNVVINNINNNSVIMPSINAINKNNNFSVNNTNNANNTKTSRDKDNNRDHSSYSRHREMHKTLEKNRRAHLRHCFEVLKDELPPNEYNEKKSSHINIISCAIRYIQHLKRTETELHYQTERLVRTKIRFQSQIAQLMDDLNEVNSNSIAGIRTVIKREPTLSAHSNDSQYEPPIDEQSDEEVIIELQNGDDCYDDETTTTASECADDIRESSNPPKAISGSLANALIYVGHA